MVEIGINSLNGNERDCLFRNNRDGSFTDVGYVNQADRVEDGRGLSIFDYDLDGRSDALVRNHKQPAQLLHNLTNDGNWIEIKLIGTRSNRDAVGAQVSLFAEGLRQLREVHAGSAYLSASSLVLHFGLGGANLVERLEIRWPSGERTTLRELSVNRYYTVREGEQQARTGRSQP